MIHGKLSILLHFDKTIFILLITLVSKKKTFFASVKIQGDSYSFYIAESKYNNQIAPSPTNFKGGLIIFKKYVFNKKVICWFLIKIYNVK
jgi:hypothetical protein